MKEIFPSKIQRKLLKKIPFTPTLSGPSNMVAENFHQVIKAFIITLFVALIRIKSPPTRIMQARDLLAAFNARLNSSSSEQLCVFFARGQCRNGSTCRFSHKSSSSSYSQDVAHREATRDPDMRQCNSIEELVQSAHEHLDTISPRGMAAFWSLLVKHAHHKQDVKSRAQFNEQLDALLARTLQILGQFSGRHLATTVLSLVKVMKQAELYGLNAPVGNLHRILHDLIVGINLEKKQYILDTVAKSSVPIHSKFDARCLSNLIYSFGLAGYTPMLECGRTILDILADEAISMLQCFIVSKDLSIILWSYAKIEASNSVLFKAAGDLIVGMEDLSEFCPQSLSNILWAYATADESHPQLFSKVGDHITAMKDLGAFLPQHFSNISWSYATADESHSLLFSKVGDHITAMKDLGAFLPQHFSNIVWSYATADELHSLLFSKVGDHIVALDDLRDFLPQALSNIVWSYATAGKTHTLLFQKLADMSFARRNKFTSQGIANLLWAYATIGTINQHLFTSFAPAVKSILDKLNSQDLANIAWAYAVANVNDPLIFNNDFINACQAKANDFEPENLSQLHQWHLWQNELKSNLRLPPTLHKKCRQVFISKPYQPSKLQDDVISELLSIGMSPEEEVLIHNGYRLDALVEVNGKRVCIEVDGPSHFIIREPTGSTLLKRRQVNDLGKNQIISVPYWEWDELGTDRRKKQEYLRCKLGLIVEHQKRMRQSDPKFQVRREGATCKLVNKNVAWQTEVPISVKSKWLIDAQ